MRTPPAATITRGPKCGFPHHAERHLHSRRGHVRHQHPRTEAGGERIVGIGEPLGRHVEHHSAALALVVHARHRGLECGRNVELPGKHFDLAARGGHSAGNHIEPVVGKQHEALGLVERFAGLEAGRATRRDAQPRARRAGEAASQARKSRHSNRCRAASRPLPMPPITGMPMSLMRSIRPPSRTQGKLDTTATGLSVRRAFS